MTIGLLILGAVLAFAVEYELAGIDITAIGFILMLGGMVGLIFGLVLWQRAGTTVTRERPVERRRVVEERDPL
jgi:hypothetical protein